MFIQNLYCDTEIFNLTILIMLCIQLQCNKFVQLNVVYEMRNINNLDTAC